MGAALAILTISPFLHAEPREPVSGLHVDLRDLVNFTNHPYGKIAKILYADLVKRPKRLDLAPEDPNYFMQVVSYDPAGPHGDSFYRVPLSPANKLKLPPELRSQSALQNEFYNLPDEVPSDYAKEDLMAIGKPEDAEKPRIAYIHERSNDSRFSKIFSAQIESEPSVDDENSNLVYVPLLTFVNLKGDYSVSFFQRFTVTVDLKAKRVVNIEEKGPEINIQKTSFSYTVDLFARKLVARDSSNDITIVYPLGVGGLDDGVTTADRARRLMTPNIENGFLIKASAKQLLQHCYPDYFNCRPFLPVFDNPNPKYGWTKLGLHGPITGHLLRGFVSHGCMRMREKDLYEVTAVLLGSSAAMLPISIVLDSETNELDHPMPLDDKHFFGVVNVGSDDEPKVQLDEEGLALTKAFNGPLNLDGISSWDMRDPGPLSPVTKKKPHH